MKTNEIVNKDSTEQSFQQKAKIFYVRCAKLAADKAKKSNRLMLNRVNS